MGQYVALKEVKTREHRSGKSSGESNFSVIFEFSRWLRIDQTEVGWGERYLRLREPQEHRTEIRNILQGIRISLLLECRVYCREQWETEHHYSRGNFKRVL